MHRWDFQRQVRGGCKKASQAESVRVKAWWRARGEGQAAWSGWSPRWVCTGRGDKSRECSRNRKPATPTVLAGGRHRVNPGNQGDSVESGQPSSCSSNICAAQAAGGGVTGDV